MTKKDYLNNLLSLCTEKQTELFNRMYPNGVDASKLKWATTQLENTLKNLNSSKEELTTVKKEAEESKKQLLDDISTLKATLDATEKDLARVTALSERLKNPITVESNEIEERLNLLNALEGAGVDNWDGYDFAIEMLSDQN